MKINMKLSMIVFSSIMFLSAFTPAIALSSSMMASNMTMLGVSNGSYYSSNWSGYAVTGSTFTSVSGSWVVPSVTGSRFTSTYAAFWTGLDGFNSGTVEQTGTLSAMINGKATYYAWYEFYPAAMVQLSGTVKPNDVISASVAYSVSGGTFTATINDKTQQWTYTTAPTKVSGATESSAEWIAEAPSSNFGVLPLANFGSVNFGQYYTSASGTCYAQSTTSSGLQPITYFGTSNIQSITMATASYNFRTHTYTYNPEATPSALLSDGASFTIVEP
jgi:hypothetical protein